MNTIEKYFDPYLLQQIEEHLANDQKQVAGVYKGYISSLGASIQQSGLIPTLAFYHDYGDDANRKSNSEQAKQPILKVLFNVLVNKRKITTSEKDLFAHAISIKANHGELRRLRRNLLDASVALKLALRTFELTDDKSNDTKKSEE